MLKPQDVLVLLRVAGASAPWTYQQLSVELGLSASEVHQALRRAEASGLFDRARRRVKRHALLEFVTHGLRYVFPAKPLPGAYGIPTAHCAEPLRDQLVVGANDLLVWPHAEGLVYGEAIEPLYPSAPEAARKNPTLHRRLALLDALRVGRVRERKLAAEALAVELGP